VPVCCARELLDPCHCVTKTITQLSSRFVHVQRRPLAFVVCFCLAFSGRVIFILDPENTNKDRDAVIGELHDGRRVVGDVSPRLRRVLPAVFGCLACRLGFYPTEKNSSWCPFAQC
jgi:hypothetical protein